MRKKKRRITLNTPPQKKISVNVDGYAPASQRLRRELTKAAKIDGWMSFYKKAKLQAAQAARDHRFGFFLVDLNFLFVLLKLCFSVTKPCFRYILF